MTILAGPASRSSPHRRACAIRGGGAAFESDECQTITVRQHGGSGTQLGLRAATGMHQNERRHDKDALWPIDKLLMPTAVSPLFSAAVQEGQAERGARVAHERAQRCTQSWRGLIYLLLTWLRSTLPASPQQPLPQGFHWAFFLKDWPLSYGKSLDGPGSSTRRPMFA